MYEYSYDLLCLIYDHYYLIYTNTKAMKIHYALNVINPTLQERRRILEDGIEVLTKLI